MKNSREMRLIKSNHSDYVDILTNLSTLITLINVIIVPYKVTCNNTRTNTLYLYQWISSMVSII